MASIKVQNSTVDEAFKKCRLLLKKGQDREYFDGHAKRYRHCIDSVMRLTPLGAKILDVGGHYLHQSVLLRLLGYEVCAMDVPAFSGLSFVEERARDLNIRLFSESHMENGTFLASYDEHFDLILFCEILEHITFNPIDFWRRIYELMNTDAKIYITTPNSARLINVAHNFKRILLFGGIGIQISEIFRNVTYGHHWKEYSKKEIIQYFKSLSPDFSVQVRFYSYRDYRRISSPKDVARYVARMTGMWMVVFDEELEIVVTLNRKTAFTATSPTYA